MPDQSILLIGQTAPTTGAGLINEVLRSWQTSDRPAVQTLSIGQVLDDPSCLDIASAAWVLLDQPQVKGLSNLIGLLHEHRLLSLLTRPDEYHVVGAAYAQGVVAVPMGTSPAIITAMLRSLLTQSSMISAMKVELNILQLLHGGVVDQFGKIDEELRLASKIQRDLLPEKLPDDLGVSCQVLFRPAGYVSGDIYDVAVLDEQHVGFFLADAVGHGVPAALMTVLIKSALSVSEPDPQHRGQTRLISPSKAMGLLNREIMAYNAGQVRTATAVYGILNTQTRIIQIARAGHPYPILLSAQNCVEHIQSDGAMLGIIDDEEYQQVQLQLEPGDRLMFFSDGFEMAFPTVANQATGQKSAVANDQYIDIFKSLGQYPVQQTIDKLTEQLDAQTGSLNQNDDLTFMVISLPQTASQQKSLQNNNQHIGAF